MIRSKTALIIVLLIPIVALFALVCYKKHILMTGREVVLPITGYDPRDLLSGHYLIYTVEYGVKNLCVGTQTVQEGYVCLDNKTFSTTAPVACNLFIRGTCNNGRFLAGIEKFYIPETNANQINQEIRMKAASIIISVTQDGVAQVKKLLVNGQNTGKSQ